MPKIEITNMKTGEIAEIRRDVSASHATWIHEQLDSSSEVELQEYLDRMHWADWYDENGNHLGNDETGLSIKPGDQ